MVGRVIFLTESCYYYGEEIICTYTYYKNYGYQNFDTITMKKVSLDEVTLIQSTNGTNISNSKDEVMGNYYNVSFDPIHCKQNMESEQEWDNYYQFFYINKSGKECGASSPFKLMTKSTNLPHPIDEFLLIDSESNGYQFDPNTDSSDVSKIIKSTTQEISNVYEDQLKIKNKQINEANVKFDGCYNTLLILINTLKREFEVSFNVEIESLIKLNKFEKLIEQVKDLVSMIRTKEENKFKNILSDLIQKVNTVKECSISNTELIISNSEKSVSSINVSSNELYRKTVDIISSIREPLSSVYSQVKTCVDDGHISTKNYIDAKFNELTKSFEILNYLETKTELLFSTCESISTKIDYQQSIAKSNLTSEEKLATQLKLNNKMLDAKNNELQHVKNLLAAAAVKIQFLKDTKLSNTANFSDSSYESDESSRMNEGDTSSYETMKNLNEQFASNLLINEEETECLLPEEDLVTDQTLCQHNLNSKILCPVCNLEIDDMTNQDRNKHANSHFSCTFLDSIF